LSGKVAELRPLYLPPDPVSRTVYLAGEIAQQDFWFPPIELPVGFGQARAAKQLPVLTMITGYARHVDGLLIPSRAAQDLFGGWWRLIARLGAVTPLTVASGEALEERVRENAALESHAEQGQLLLPWVAVLAAAMVLYVVLENRRAKTGARPRGTPRSWLAGRPAALVLAAIALVTAAGSAYVVVLIGHSGAQATWSQIGTTANDGGDAVHR
jgi:hypothetical protein